MIGKTVWHKTFGKGEVCAYEAPYIRVCFETPGLGEKSFLYPAAFESFLRFEDEVLETKVKEELEKFRQTEQEQRRKRKEELKRREEEQLALIREQTKAKRSTAKTRSIAKNSKAQV